MTEVRGESPILEPSLSTHPVRSEAWFNDILSKKLGYESLRDWQLRLTMALCNGRDAICIIATGAGKSALIQGPILAYEALGENAVGITVVPTKGLADDQTIADRHEQRKAKALRGKYPPGPIQRNQKWAMVAHILGPEMLTSSKFSALLKNTRFVDRIKTVVIDECHLSDEWKEFRGAYQDIKRLRNRLPSRIAWLALSGTISPEEFPALSLGLGFLSGQYELVRESVDRPNIKYVLRILRHATSGHSMLDFSWLIPREMTDIDEIPITIVFVNTISHGHKLRTYLTSLLPSHITGRSRTHLVRGYHGMSTSKYRKESVAALRAGNETRILVCTDTGAFGIDITEVKQVVIAQMSKTFKTQTQRIGRIRGKGTAYVYFPAWMVLTNMSKEAVSSRKGVEQVMIDFANPSLNKCPRRTACLHWGEEFVQPPDCCVLHDPDELQHELEVDWRLLDVQERTVPRFSDSNGPRASKSNGSRRVLDKKVMMPVVIKFLEEWRLHTWQTASNRLPNSPAETLISDELL
ncbi:P-loop containing nucleoside triphosphate hydrolase protein [Ceratobasidium sp. AG-I]|nr:P-loop containing nucleoside triphosphate hydrolase protein [Ceratobasidium sp. AG-I]